MRYLAFILIILMLATPCFGTTRIFPSADITYDGMFLVPESDGSVPGALSYKAGMGIAYSPTGDSGSGSLYYNCNWNKIDAHNKVAELRIPADEDLFTPTVRNADGSWSTTGAVTATVINECKTAAQMCWYTYLDPLMTAYDGSTINQSLPNPYSDCDIEGIAVLPAHGSQVTPKLYTTSVHRYTLPAFYNTYPYGTLGWAELDLNTPNIQGYWQIYNPAVHTAAYTSAYMTPINETFADSYFGGKYLGIGRGRGQSGGSRGNTFSVIAPWSDGNPPNDKDVLASSKLLIGYGEDCDGGYVNRYSHEEDSYGAAWLTVGAKHALAIYVQKGMRESGFYTCGDLQLGTEIYGESKFDLNNDGVKEIDDFADWQTGILGYMAYPKYATILFYDADDLANTYADSVTYPPEENQPYAFFNIQTYLISPWKAPDEGHLYDAGMTYDEINHKLYVVEKQAIDSNGQQAVHVFSITDTGSSLDTTAPSTPTNVTYDNFTHTVHWNASTDNVTNASDLVYIIYRTQPVKQGFFPTGICRFTSQLSSRTVCSWVDRAISDLVIYEGDPSWTYGSGDDYPNYYYRDDDSIVYQDYPVGITNVNNQTSWEDLYWNDPVYWGHQEYKVQAMDKNGNLSALSASHIAGDSDVSPPTISGSAPSGTIACTNDPQNITISVQPYDPSPPITCRYSASNVAYSSMPAGSMSAEYQATVSSSCDTAYTFYVRCIDNEGNAMTSSETITYTMAAQSTGPSTYIQGAGQVGGGMFIQ